jgi:putative aldouronate transport system substrate-binding protein
MFGYWDGTTYWLDNGDGTLQNAYTADHYREGLKFINKLYKEGLMTPLTVTGSSSEMKRLVTPATGPSLVGMFIGHLTIACTPESENLYEYVPVPFWSPAVEKRCPVSREIYITTDCPEENRDLAFAVLDLLLSDEGSMRVRYGEKDVNWQEYTGTETAPAGGVWKWEMVGPDQLGTQTNALWSSAMTITPCSELFNMKQPATDWFKYKIDLVWEQYQNYMKAMEQNPDRIYPGPRYTDEEDERTGVARENTITACSTYMTEFITGVKDPNSDAQWEAYLKELDSLGMQEWQEVSEASWNRLLEAGFKG